MKCLRRDSVLTVCCLVLALGGTGCSTTAMKGTPFFESAPSKSSVTSSTERVNAWPLLYYREGALSVIWPLIDYRDDCFAFRPLFSVYGLDADRQEYNVLWPLSHFEEGQGDNWILPFFWGDKSWIGDDYVVGFPLYWHAGHPLSKDGGTDALFPLWFCRGYGNGYDLDVLWPVAEFKARTRGRQRDGGWRIWPLYGSYQEGDDHYRFVGWPLANFWWNDKRDASTQCVLPLWYWQKDRGHSLFVSLPYSRGSDSDGSSWWLVPPLAYRDSNKDSSHLFTPLYWCGRDGGKGTAWDVLLPLFYSRREPKGSAFATLLGGYTRSGEESGWFAVPLLSGGRYGAKTGSTWWLGGLGYRGASETRKVWHVLPLGRSVTESNRWHFLSLPWSGGESDGGDAWSLTPPLWFHSRDAGGELTLTPLYMSGSETGGEHRRWSALMPFYYTRDSDRGTAFVTLLGGRERDKVDGTSWMLYPLLTGGRLKGDDGSLWVLGPMFHARWDKNGTMHHLFPLYYWNGVSDAFISLPFSQWGTEGSRLSVVPPLLSILSRNERRSDLWTAAGLVHWSWGKEAGARHIFPLYVGDVAKDWHVTPAFVSWKYGADGHGVAVPPLLSWYMSTSKRDDLWVAGPLAHWSWGKEAGSRHIFPVYVGDIAKNWHVTPAFASWKYGADGRGVAVPPLLSWYMSTSKRDDLWIVGPLAHLSWGELRGGSHLFPLAYWNTRTSAFVTPLYATWMTERVVRHTLIPPILGYHERNRKDWDFWLAMGLFHIGATDGEEGSGRGHLVPLYLYDKGLFLTPLFGWNNGKGDDFVYPFTPLLGFWRNEQSGMWLFPVFSRCRDVKTGSVSGNVLWGFYRSERDEGRFTLFPLLTYRRWDPPGRDTPVKSGLTEGCDVNYLLFGRYSAEHSIRSRYVVGKGAKPASVASDYREKRNRFFPLWWCRSESWGEGEETTSDLRFLLLLYDHRREHRATPVEGESGEYVRSRILHYFWHYQRLDDAVSVDLFPAITYDRQGDAKRKFSFLWRGFRYERSKDQRALDLLFIPIWRTSWVGGGN